MDYASSDETLVQMARKGDRNAFDELFRRYKKAILNFVHRYIGNKETAEEVTQEVFVNVYKNLRIFDPKRKFSVWVYTIARNLAKNALRDKRYFKDVSLEESVAAADETIKLKDMIVDPNPQPDAVAEDEELAKEAQKILKSMPPKLREVVTLCSIQGLTEEEAARILGCSVASVSIRLNRAKEAFIRRLGIDLRQFRG
jgi:RNA polymerase sigma-70 factor (ECF subfamily)